MLIVQTILAVLGSLCVCVCQEGGHKTDYNQMNHLNITWCMCVFVFAVLNMTDKTKV